MSYGNRKPVRRLGSSMAHPRKRDFTSRTDTQDHLPGPDAYKHVAMLCVCHPALTQPQSSSGFPKACYLGCVALRESGDSKKNPPGDVPLLTRLTCPPPPPPPSTADSSHPSTGLTCFHGNWNPGLWQPLVLPPVITSSLKCKAS